MTKSLFLFLVFLIVFNYNPYFNVSVEKAVIKYINETAPDIKGVYFYNRPNLSAAGYYTPARTITFYRELELFPALWVAAHEVCHHQIYRKHHSLSHHDKRFQDCVLNATIRI